MKIRVLLYKAKWGDKSFIDNAISIWTRSKYSHIEIWLPDSDGFFFKTVSQCLNPDDAGIVGTCWTSTMRGDDNGTVMRDACGVLKNPDRWEYVEVDVEEDEYGCVVWYMTKEVHKNRGYSFWDILNFISPIHWNDEKKNICSEFVNNALCYGGVVDGKGIQSPEQVYRKLMAKGYEVRRMK